MLDIFRKRTNNIAFTFLILLIAAVMAMFGVDQFNNSQRSGGGAAAWVNGEMISQEEFQNTLQNQLAGIKEELRGQLDEKLILSLGLPQRALKQLIQLRLLDQEAVALGFRVPDSELAEHIRKLPYFQVNGQFDPTLYARLPNRGLEERRQRKLLLVGKLQDYLEDRVKLTPQDQKRQAGLQRVNFNVRFAAIDFNELANRHQPTSVEIEAFLAATPAETLKQYYDAHRDAYTDRPRYRMSQIRVGLPFGATEDKRQEAQKKINELMPKLNAKNFAELAKQYSDDEFATSGGDRGWVDTMQLEPESVAALEKMKVGEVSTAVEGPGGYYAFLLHEKKDKVVKPLESVKKEVATALLKDKQRSEFEAKYKEQWNTMLAKGTSIEPELKKFGISMQETGKFNLDQGFIPKIGPGDAIWDTLFTMKGPGAVGSKLALNEGKYYFVQLKEFSREGGAPSDKDATEAGVSLQSRLQSELYAQWIDALEKEARIKTELDFSAAPV